VANIIETRATIDNTPEAVLSYIADVRNRPYYLPSLKTVSDLQIVGDHGAGTKWKWTWLSLGMEFTGTAECLKYEPGKVYSFRTQGGISSTWTYTVTPSGSGTDLHIQVEFEVPENARSRLPAAPVADNLKKVEAERVVQNLKAILDR
jgi:carbon monoxide dehydrogenase subunit G